MGSFAIAKNTFKEAIRHRILYLLLLFAVGIIAAGRVLGELTVGDKMKIIGDIGLASISVFTVLVAIFLGIGLVSREIEKRTIFVVLAKPVARYQFIFGKAFGLAMLLLVITAVLALELVLIYRFFGGVWATMFFASAALAFFESLMLLSMSLVFSTFTTPILATLYTFAFYVIGHFSWTFKMVSERPSTEAEASVFWYALYLILPNLERFNIRAEIVHGVAIEHYYQIFVPMVYSLLYSLFLLFIASVIFERKDLT